ncbi:MAG: hypothetical protein ACLF0P_16980 [Thermoanaerobaculia bacterium]
MPGQGRRGAEAAGGGELDRLAAAEERLGRRVEHARRTARRLVDRARRRARTLEEGADAALEEFVAAGRAEIEAEASRRIEDIEADARRRAAVHEEVQGERVHELAGLVRRRVLVSLDPSGTTAAARPGSGRERRSGP